MIWTAKRAVSRHDRVRPRKTPHGERAALVRGFRARRALRDPEPDPDFGGICRLPDRERRYPPDPLRRRILPRPQHAGSARAWLPALGASRAGRGAVSLYRGRIAGRIPRAVEPVPETGLCRRHHLPRAGSDRTRPGPHDGRGDAALDGVQPAPRTGAGRHAEILDPQAAGVNRAPPHSITSAARSRKDSGIASPSVLAVLRLTTTSNLTGACTGRSAGFSPLRM